MADNETLTLPAEAKAAIESIRSMKTSTDALTADNEAIKARIAAIEAKNQETIRAHSMSLPGSEDYAKDYNVGRATRALLTGEWDKAPFEREIHEQTFKRMPSSAQQRIMTTVTPSAGGFLVPEEMATAVVPKFDASSICKAAGATVIKPKGWPYKVNKITGGTTAAYAAEGSGPSASDITLGQVQFNPRKISARTFVTMEQIQYGTPQTDTIIVDDLMKRVALLQDRWALRGTGSSEPLGVLNTTGINTNAGVLTTPANTLGFVDISRALKELEIDDVPIDGATLIVNPTNKYEMFENFYSTISSGTIAASGASFMLGLPFMSDAEFTSRTGVKIFTTTQMPDTSAFVGVMKWLWLAEFGGFVISRSSEASDGTNHAFVTDGTHLKVTGWFDSAVVQAAAFSAITAI